MNQKWPCLKSQKSTAGNLFRAGPGQFGRGSNQVEVEVEVEAPGLQESDRAPRMEWQ